MLDIGCGWGGLICYAAQNYGVIAHGVTLSENQVAWTREKIAKLGLSDRVTVELCDYTSSKGNSTRFHRSKCSSMSALPTIRRSFKPCTGC